MTGIAHCKNIWLFTTPGYMSFCVVRCRFAVRLYAAEDYGLSHVTLLGKDCMDWCGFFSIFQEIGRCSFLNCV
jgi:hypothetical protein